MRPVRDHGAWRPVRFLNGLGVGVFATGSVVVSVLAHLSTAPGRRLAAGVTTDALAPLFRGRIVVDRIDALSVFRGHVAFAGRIFDPAGREVMAVEAASARIDLSALVKSLPGSKPLAIRLDKVDIGPGRVALWRTPTGDVSIAETFEPRTPSPPGPGGKPVEIAIAPIHVAGVRIGGDLIPMSAFVRTMDASVGLREPNLELGVRSLNAEVSGPKLPPMTVAVRNGRATIPTGATGSPRVAAEADVTASGGRAHANVRWEETIDLVLNAEGSPELAKAFALPVTPTQNVRVELHAKGPLNGVAIDARVQNGGGTITIAGKADIPALAADAKITLEDVDARAAVATAPTTSVSGTIDVWARGREGRAHANVHLARGRVVAQTTPEIDANVLLDKMVLSANVHAREPGTKVDIEGTLPLATADPVARVHVVAESRDLARVRAIVPAIRGSAKVDAKGTLALSSGAIGGKVKVDIDGFAYGTTARVGHARVDAELSGSIEQPAALTQVRAEDVAVGSIRGDRATAGGMIRAGSLVIDAPYATIERDDTIIRAEAARVKVARGVVVERVRVTGLGGPIEGDARITPERISVVARGKGVELAPLVRIGALPPDMRGSGEFDVDLTLDAAGVNGRAAVKFIGTPNKSTPNVAASLTLAGHGRVIDVEAHGDVDAIGGINIPRGRVVIDGDPRTPKTWLRAAGDVSVDTDVSISDLVEQFVPSDTLRAEGRARGRIRFHRAFPGGPIDTDVDLKTRGFALVAKDVALRGAELTVHGRLKDDIATATVEAFDRRGPLFTARAALAMGALEGKGIGQAPMHAELVVPARSIDALSIRGEPWGARTRAAAIVEAAGTLHHAKLSGWLRATVEGLGSVRVDELAGTWSPTRETLPRGTAVVHTHLDLDGISETFRDRMKDLPKLGGLVDVELSASRSEGEAFPNGRISVRTYGLRVSEPFTLRGTDIRATAEVHSATGEVAASAAAWDNHGAIVVADAKSLLPSPLTPAMLAASLSNWGQLPMSARVAVPPRPISTLFALFDAAEPQSRSALRTEARSKRIEGGIAMELGLEGTIENPKAQLRAYGLGLRELPRNRNAESPGDPLDAAIFGLYDGKRADIGMTIVDKGRAALLGTATAVVSSAELARKGEAPIVASADVRARGLRVGALPFVGEDFKGDLTANVMLRDYGENARLEATIDARDVVVERLRFTRTEARIVADGKRLSAAVGLSQADGGWAGAMLTSNLKWGSAAAPTLDDGGSMKLDYRVDGFRLAGLRPLVRQAMPELDGKIDGRGSIVREGGTERAEGHLLLRNGSAYVAALGQSIEDANLDLRLNSDTFFIENARARIDRGEVRFAAAGRLRGLTPTGIRAELSIPKRADLPIYVEGVRYGNATGHISIDAKLAEKESRVDINVPQLQFELAGLDPRSLQQLDPADDVKVGFRDERGELRFVQLQRLQRVRPKEEATQESAKPLVVHIHLGDKVVISQGTTIYVPISGNLDAIVKEELRLRGSLQLANGGIINLQGRKFRIQNGSITWTENDDPANPVVIAAAEWQAPDQDKTMVIATFTGPAKTGKLDLSAPGKSKGDALMLVLFGTTERAGTSGGSATGTVVGAGGGVAAGGLGRAMSKLTDYEIEASVKTKDERTTRPEVAVRLRRNLTVQVASEIGTGAGQLREPILLKADWNFARGWSIQGEEGLRWNTTILDLIWQYRY